MNDSKLIELYRTLSSQEKKQLQEYVYCDFLNKSREAARLCDFIYQSDNSNAALDKKKAYQYAFQQKTYQDSKMRRLMSALLKLIEDFLLYMYQQANEKKQKINLAEIYFLRGLPKHFNSTIRGCEKLQNADTQINEEYYYRQYLIEDIKSQYLSRQDKRRTEPNLEQVSHTLDVFYLISKLKKLCAIYVYKNLFKYEYDVKMLDEILLHIAENDYSNTPAIPLYYSALLVLMGKNDKDYFAELKYLLHKHNDSLALQEGKELHLIARNYCIKKLNKGEAKYGQELFELYETGLNNKVLFSDDLLYTWTYKNIVAVGLKLKNFDWTEKFIHHYKSFLPTKQREDAFAFNLARLFFEKNEYQQVIQLLNTMKIDELTVQLDVKVILLKTYYELEEWNVLFLLIDSFKIFLRRKKGLGYHKDNYRNIIKYVKQLSNVNHYDKEAVQKLKQEITETHLLTEKKWLLQKVNELIK
ncbi:MAG: hypothetical protein ACPG5B_15530 [Chitinophagales bacterium]